VGDLGDQPGAAAFGVGEGCRQRVDVFDQRCQARLAGEFEDVVVVPLGEPVRGGAHRVERTQQKPGQGDGRRESRGHSEQKADLQDHVAFDVVKPEPHLDQRADRRHGQQGQEEHHDVREHQPVAERQPLLDSAQPRTTPVARRKRKGGMGGVSFLAARRGAR
jgi:hypothetical protein